MKRYDLSHLCEKHSGLKRLWSIFPEARLVGGCVRDSLLGQVPHDIDMAVPYPPERVIEKLKAAKQRFFPTGLEHGTVSVLIKGEIYELTSLRQDLVTDGRHAQVAWTADWQKDAERRDFTINAMSMDKTGKLYDYFGGEADLRLGKVRFVGVPALRIQEDYLRILRYFRFSARFEQEAPSKKILKVISEALEGFATLAKERIRDEFSKILLGPHLIRTLYAMEEAGILKRLFQSYEIEALNTGLALDLPEDFILRLYVLCPEIEILKKTFALSNKEKKRLSFFAHFGNVFELTSDMPTLLKYLDQYPLSDLMAYSYIAEIKDAESVISKDKTCKNDWEILRQRLQETVLPEFPVAGRDLLERNVEAGPQIGALLKEMRLYWLAQEAKVTKQEILKYFGLQGWKIAKEREP
ncbi:CCA tRNA nucleotidyltransferase [Acetobacteraceae bacterium]|nr:CCA tRNA nucleotidyltransferase [Acetobacteraceae bacterium]